MPLATTGERSRGSWRRFRTRLPRLAPAGTISVRRTRKFRPASAVTLYITRRLLVLAAIAAVGLWGEDFTGKVVAITDGDTIKVMHDGVAERIRLWGIDAPESRQPVRNAGQTVYG